MSSTDWDIWLTVTESIVFSWAVARLVFAGALEIPLKVRGKKPFPRITRDFILILCYAILVFIVLRLQSNINLVSNFGVKLVQGSPEEVQNDPQVLEVYLGVK